MSEQPRMPPPQAWVVTINWSDGLSSLSGTLAPNMEAAVAICTAQSLRGEPAPKGEVAGVMARSLPLEWLRMAVRAIETGQPPGAQVLSLVPKAAEPEAIRHPGPGDLPTQATTFGDALLRAQFETEGKGAPHDGPPEGSGAA